MESTKRFEISGYTVTGDSKVTDELFGINEEVQSVLQKMNVKVAGKKSKFCIDELLGLIEKYPRIPQFKNLLSTLYAKQGNFKKAKELNQWLITEHPDYLFGKLNLANEHIFIEEFEKVPEILGEFMEIKTLYPSRNEFHINEVVSFCQTSIRYFVGIEDIEAAELRLEILKKLNEEFKVILSDEIEKIEFSILAARMKKGHELYLKQAEKAREVEVIPVEVVEQATEKPEFTNSIIDQLYCNSLRINHGLLREILLLPRKSLIADLHKVVYDSIARYDYFSEETIWSPETHEFLQHAILLLTELKSVESLKVIFDILRQDAEYLDYWFGDNLTGSIWEYLFVSGQTNLDKFRSFLFEPNHYSIARSVISEAVVQIAFHLPERKNEIINWFKDIIEEILARKDEEKIIDTDWIGFIVSDLLDINAVELSPLLKKLFDAELISEYICGNYEDVLRDFNSPKDYTLLKKEIFKNIFLKYNQIVATWPYYNEKGNSKDRDFENEGDEDFNTSNIPKNTGTDLPYINPNKGIGRNDPCPCGSGEKYKKCCMKI